MPGMDGYQTTIAIRKLGFTGPVVAVTAMSAVEETEKVKQSGMNHILSKVATFRALCAISGLL
jgi:CheY-like chemotaxis protein